MGKMMWGGATTSDAETRVTSNAAPHMKGDRRSSNSGKRRFRIKNGGTEEGNPLIHHHIFLRDHFQDTEG